jgi:hypothetical protein
MTTDYDSIRQDLRRQLALLALEQLDPCAAIDWARSVVELVPDSHGLRVLAGCDRDSVGVWLRHAGEELCVVFPNREESAKLLAQACTSERGGDGAGPPTKP